MVRGGEEMSAAAAKQCSGGLPTIVKQDRYQSECRVLATVEPWFICSPIKMLAGKHKGGSGGANPSRRRLPPSPLLSRHCWHNPGAWPKKVVAGPSPSLSSRGSGLDGAGGPWWANPVALNRRRVEHGPVAIPPLSTGASTSMAWMASSTVAGG
jgi:hypothetical protein